MKRWAHIIISSACIINDRDLFQCEFQTCEGNVPRPGPETEPEPEKPSKVMTLWRRAGRKAATQLTKGGALGGRAGTAE